MTARAKDTSDAALAQTIRREVAKRVVSQEMMVERLLIGLLTGGHILLEGVPGLAKTLVVRTMAECLRISFSRIQFTPDLRPADVIGTMVYDQRSQEFYPKKYPLFANLELADEINSSPPKVQSALLEAMHEKQDTIGGESCRQSGCRSSSPSSPSERRRGRRSISRRQRARTRTYGAGRTWCRKTSKRSPSMCCGTACCSRSRRRPRIWRPIG